MFENRKFGYFLKFFNPFCPGTEEFVPGHLLLSLYRDKDTKGRPVPVYPWTSRPVETLLQNRSHPTQSRKPAKVVVALVFLDHHAT